MSTFIELSSRTNGYITLENNLNTLRNICTGNLNNDSGCKMLIPHLLKKIKNLSDTNALIFGSGRKKRALLDIVGNIASDLFGVLDSRFGEQYAHDMSKLKKNDEHLLRLLKNHTSIIESTLNVLDHNGDELEKQSAHLQSLTLRVNEIQDILMAGHKFDSAVTYLLQMISEYSPRDDILRLLMESRKSIVSHVLFTPKQIEDQLELISRHIGSNLVTPREIDVYSCSKITHFKLGNQIMFKISIPLFKLQKYRLFKVIPVPFAQNNVFSIIKNEVNYLATSTDNQFYQYLSEIDIRSCKYLSEPSEMLRNGLGVWFTA